MALDYKNRKLSKKHKIILSESHKGDKNPQWKGGITPEIMKIRNSLEYKIWRKDIFGRDDYTCQICGERGGVLRANHIKKFADYPELRFEPTNGIVICKDCDVKWVLHHEPDWESYFNFNLMNRNILNYQYKYD